MHIIFRVFNVKCSKVHFTAAAQLMNRKRAVRGFAALPNILFCGCQKVKTVKVLFSKHYSSVHLLDFNRPFKGLWWYLRLKCQHFQDYLDWGIIKHYSRKFPFHCRKRNKKCFVKAKKFCFLIILSKYLGKPRANQTPLDKILNHQAHTHHCRRCGHF